MREDQAKAMEDAIRAGDVAAARRLLAGEPRLTGTPIPVRHDWGEEMWLGLHLAAELGLAELVMLLLDAGASIDARTRFRTPMHGRQTALMLAAKAGHAAVVELLLSRHASVDLLDATHLGALAHAAANGYSRIISQLIEHGAVLDPVDDQQRTPLHWAIRGGFVEASLALIDAGASLDHCCPKEPAGFTPLHRCVSVGGPMLAVAKRLREAGADTTLRDPRHGKTADELAAELS